MTRLLDAIAHRLPALQTGTEPEPTLDFAGLIVDETSLEPDERPARPPENADENTEPGAKAAEPAKRMAVQVAPTVPFAAEDQFAALLPFGLVVPPASPTGPIVAPEADAEPLAVATSVRTIPTTRLDAPAPRIVEPKDVRARAPTDGPTAQPVVVDRPAGQHSPVQTTTKPVVALAPASVPSEPWEATAIPKRIDIVLEPERLGRLRVTLSLAGGRAQLRIVASTEAGFVALNADRDALLPILRDVRGGEGELRIVLQADPASHATASEAWSLERGDRAAPERNERWSRPEREGAERDGDRNEQRPGERGAGRETREGSRHGPHRQRDPETL